MTEAFVPFTSKSSPAEIAEPFRVKAASAATSTAVPFQPASPVVSASHPPSAHSHQGGAQVSLVRDGDRITSIRVQCACGEVIELQCQY